ncbi:uncharacterized protein LOC143920415 [Arctopsyche grandis]|uniref:uncharacterized protein LOC143920415 n=1 Tax=Arctopsyche grandis TaxID=121162 RepID=UPI00406D867C
MAEGTYEHACMRAELLGLEKPNEEEFYRHQPKPNIDESLMAAQFECTFPETERKSILAITARKTAKDISLQNDELKQVGGGLTELNTILSGTQKKLNKIKGMYGSLTDIIRNKITGSRDNISYSTDPSYLPPDGAGPSGTGANINEALNDLETMKSNQDRSIGMEINQQVSSQVDKLDSLLNKADTALCSMEHQNKQMKKVLRK